MMGSLVLFRQPSLDPHRKMEEGHNMLHAGGDGRSNGVGIIVNMEISKDVVRVER